MELSIPSFSNAFQCDNYNKITTCNTAKVCAQYDFVSHYETNIEFYEQTLDGMRFLLAVTQHNYGAISVLSTYQLGRTLNN